MSESHTPQRPLILGSTSRYRRELVERLNLPFTTVSPEVDETPLPGEAPGALALRLALAKAHAVAALHPEAIVIGSDQVSDLHGQPMGKPGTHERAVEMLRAMRGQTVMFHTAVAVVCQATGFAQSDVAVIRTVFRSDLSDDAIERYLRAEQPYDCAGSAKSETLGGALMQKVEADDPNSLIGVPLFALVTMLQNEGVEIL